MDSGEKKFEIGISRHAPKVESGRMDVENQEVDVEEAKQKIIERASFFLGNLDHAPEGTIMAFQPSNIKRTEQTRNLLVDQLKKSVRSKDIEIVELGENKEVALELLDRIKKESKKKFIIADLRGTWLIGFRSDDFDFDVVDQWRNKLNDNEDLLGKVWAARKNELAIITEQLNQKGFDIKVEDINLKDFQSTPEDQVVRFVKWLQAMKKIGESRFPDRPLMLEGISHNLRLDYTMLSLLGEDISVESIDRILGGEFRKPLERLTITFIDDGKIRIEYRGMSKEYTQEDFDKLIRSIKEKSAIRKKEWMM